MHHAKFTFSAAAKLFLRIALPLLTLTSIALLIAYLQQRQIEPIMARVIYRPLLEYIVAGWVVTSFFSLLIDTLARGQS